MKRYLIVILLFATQSQVFSQVPTTLDSLHIFLKTQPKDTLYVWAMRPYTIKIIYEKADYKKADSLTNQVKILSEKLNYGRGIYFHYLLKAIIHNQKTEAEQSLENFKKSYETVKKYKLPASLEEASLNNIAVGYEQLGNRDKALQYALQAIKVQEVPNFPVRWLDSAPYGLVSNIYKFKKQLKQAEKYNQLAFAISKKKNDKIGMAIQKNKLGNIYDDQNLPKEALKAYTEGLKYAMDAEYLLLQTDLLSNLGRILTLLKKYDEAEKYLKKNENLCEQLESPKALKSAYINLGELYQAQNKTELAIKYFKRAYEQTKSLDDFNDKLIATRSLSKSYAQIGDYKNAYNYLLEANIANDSLFSTESDAKMQELLTIYESEKKETQIKLLNEETQNANFQRNTFLFGGILAILLASLAIFSISNRNKLKRFEEEQRLRNRIAADLHDEIGSTLSSISILSEIVAFQQKKGEFKPEIMQQVSNDAREVIEKMDDIIWTINPSNDAFYNLETRLKTFAIPLFESKDIDFKFDFDAELEKIKIGMGKRRDIYLILKEAINNLVKYSQCKNALISGKIEAKSLIMSVKDDGIGFDTNAKTVRNGQRNIKMRAEKIGANLVVNSEIGSGTEVTLAFEI